MGPNQTTENEPSHNFSDGGVHGITYPTPLTDVVNRVGGPNTIDVATWNLENFPMTSQTPEQVANIIASLDLDLLGVQEISDVDAFEELLARLPYHDGFLSSHTYVDGAYQKVGFIWRHATVFECRNTVPDTSGDQLSARVNCRTARRAT